MKIAINCAFYQPQGGGIKEYIQNLIENLSIIAPKDCEIILYVLSDYYDYAKENLKTKFKIKQIPFKGRGLINTIIRSIFEGFYWRKEEKVEKWDLFHSPFFHSPRLKSSKLIVTVHDLRFHRYPNTYTLLRFLFLKKAVKRAVKRADKIISISYFTKEELIDAYKIPDNKIIVVHEAINPDHFKKSFTLSQEEGKFVKKLGKDPFVLSVGHLEPRKNYARLIRAFKKITPKIPKDSKLVIVGKLGHDYAETLSLINQNNNVLYLNFVSQDMLNWLYSNATLFAFPSFYEGFGFPPMEAAMHGTISAVSNTSSIPEVCGKTALYFNPFDEEDIANKLRAGITDENLRAKLQSLLPEHLSKFSWQKNAEQTLNLYYSISQQN